MSDTPRTDAEVEKWHAAGSFGPIEFMAFEFARELERELAEARAEQRAADVKLLRELAKYERAIALEREAFAKAIQSGRREQRKADVRLLRELDLHPIAAPSIYADWLEQQSL